MEELKVDIQTTDDGSLTLFVPELDEHYHSVKGALTESKHIFINMGLRASEAEEPRILEVGFGTGLNALLTLQESEIGRKVHYTTIERYPLSKEVTEKMEYSTLVDTETAEYYSTLHEAEWNKWVKITERFNLRKLNTDLTTLELKEKYDIIYFDAFAPEKQPEMWTQTIFDMMYNSLDVHGILVTYCAKGAVRRMMQNAGFAVERLAGPPNVKREILRGKKLTMANYTITEATMDDAEQIAQFQIEMAQETENLQLEYKTVKQGVEALIEESAKGIYLIARKEDGTAVGSLMVTKEWSDWHCSWYWWIQSVYVSQEHRGQGIFKMLYNEVVRRAKDEKVKEVRLYVEHTNERAQKTYQKVGMRQSHYLMYEVKI